MEEIGLLLKELRLKKGLSIDDIQEITKIRSRYIQAIEEGNLEKLPGQFYAKAFIKAYADIVELDQDVLAAYQKSLPEPDLDGVMKKSDINQMASTPSKASKWFFASIIYILIGLVILFVYMFYVSYLSDQGEELPGNPIEQQRLDVPQQNNPSPDPTTEPSQGQTEENEKVSTLQINKLSSSTINKSPRDEYIIIAPSDMTVNLKLKFTDRCWYSVRMDSLSGKELSTGIFTKGQETDSFTLKDQMLWVHLGNTAGAEIYINDQKIDLGDVKGNPKYFSFVRKEQ